MLILILTLVASAGAADATPPTEIRLRRAAQLQSHVVRVGDVADIAGEGDEANRLASLILIPAPAPGTQQFFTQQDLRNLLAARGLEMTRLRIGGAEQMTLSTAARETDIATHEAISREAQRRADRQDVPLTSLAKNLAGTGELHTEVVESMRDYVIAKTGQHVDWRFDFELPERHWRLLDASTAPLIVSGGNEPWTGEQRLLLAYETAKGPAYLPVRARITCPEQVVVAVRSIERGATITAADVELQQVEISTGASAKAQPIRSLEEAIGMEASRTIAEGEFLRPDVAKPPVLVRRGEEVTVIAQGGGIRIRTTARARQDGARGDLVQVESLASRERFDVRVTGVGEVTVHSPTSNRISGRGITGRRY